MPEHLNFTIPPLALAIIVGTSLFATSLLAFFFPYMKRKYAKRERWVLSSFFSAAPFPLFFLIWVWTIWAICLVAFADDAYAPIRWWIQILTFWVSFGLIGWLLFLWKKRAFALFFTKEEKKWTPSSLLIVNKVITVFLLFFLFLAFLKATGMQAQSVLTFGGIGGIALALAAQDVIGNFFSGFMLHIARPFAIGDTIRIQDRNVTGVVEDIGWYLSTLSDAEIGTMYVPNACFSKAIVYNHVSAPSEKLSLHCSGALNSLQENLSAWIAGCKKEIEKNSLVQATKGITFGITEWKETQLFFDLIFYFSEEDPLAEEKLFFFLMHLFAEKGLEGVTIKKK